MPAAVLSLLQQRFGAQAFTTQPTQDGISTLWVHGAVREVLHFMKHGMDGPFLMLFDLTAIDERFRRKRNGQPAASFTLVYHLLSPQRNEDIRLKSALEGESPEAPSVCDLWPSAAWYEREVWDMFGIRFQGHPLLRRILLPPTWVGHPLRKEHPARATESPHFTLPTQREEEEQEALRFHPEEWGLRRQGEGNDFLFLNIGPQHPGTHGPFRIVLQLDGEEIVAAVPEIGFHHRGAEKMAERQTWHTFLPYTDRIDYLGGILNNLAYVLAVEKLAGIEVPDRVKLVRIMLAELFRISSHLVWYGTFAQDLGYMSPVFYLFNDRERLLEIVEAVCGARMHPSWLRIGGLANDLPAGWRGVVQGFLDYFPRRLREYDTMLLGNSIFRRRTKGIGAYGADEAWEWGVTGPGLRACGVEWDFRRQRPYSGYEQLEFDIPTAANGDCYDRAVVHVAEMRQSLRIVAQCLEHIPDSGPHKADHPLTTPPVKERTLRDIETLITHFVASGWGPVIPAGEAAVPIEAAKGCNSYYLISDGGASAYRGRIRTPSFAHLQMIPRLSRGMSIADLMALLGSIDFVLADVDR